MVDLKFNVKKHEYRIGGKKALSVTQLVGSLFKPFDARGLARKLASFSWAKAQKKGVRYWLGEWKKAADYGTLIHEGLEDFINKVPNSIDEPKYHQGVNYLNSLGDGVELKSEFKVFDEDSLLAGTIDLLEINGDEVVITDWKTNKKMTDKPYEEGDVGLESPVSHLTNCKVNHYYLQLLIYSYILEKNYGYKVVGLQLVWLQDDSYTVYKFGLDRGLRQEIINWRLKQNGKV